MIKYAFTEAQAAHALEVVLKLMKERRFFLYQQPRSIEKDPSYVLNPQVFGPAIKLDREVREAYATVRSNAERSILMAEHELGVTKPDLRGNKQLVQCNRYTGGLDICCVYPLTAFARHIPKSLKKLSKQCLEQLLQGRTEDDLAPKVMQLYHDKAQCVSEKIWDQFQMLEAAQNPANSRCVVMMESRFDCGGSDENHDFMQGRTRDMQKFPHALGYLFYKHSMQNRIVRHNHVVFSTSRDSHVNVQHWRGKKPSIYYDADDGYICSVIFVTVL